MAKKQKTFRPRARLPRGFVDRDAADIRGVSAMLGNIAEVFERYGFDPVETPMFEYTEALGKFLPDSDRPNEGVFSLTDDDDQWLSLRYDLTAPLARHVAENINTIQLPYRTYRAGYVFRNEKPGPGRFRQFMQFDADTVGAPSITADAEMCMMMADTMEALGIQRGDYVVRVNNRKVLDGVMEAIGLGGDDNAGRRLTVLRAIDKLDRLGIEGVRELLGDGRKDESGDFTRGAGLGEKQVSAIAGIINLSDFGDLVDGANTSTVTAWQSLGFDINQKFEAGIGELQQMARMFDACGYETDRITIDFTVVRGLEYYTGPVYECELLFDVTNEKGEVVQFGSVAGGGRYDGLVQRFTGQPVPATGFSIGVSRLMTALKNLGQLETGEVLAPVLVCVMDRDADAIGGYQQMVQELRDAGIRAELYHGNPKNFGKQLQYADRRGCPLAIIEGGDERAAGEVQIKDLAAGAEAAKSIDSRAEWVAERPAQVSAKRNELVTVVSGMLARMAGPEA